MSRLRRRPDHGGDVVVRVLDVVVAGEVIERCVATDQAVVADELGVVAVVGTEVLGPQDGELRVLAQVCGHLVILVEVDKEAIDLVLEASDGASKRLQPRRYAANGRIHLFADRRQQLRPTRDRSHGRAAERAGNCCGNSPCRLGFESAAELLNIRSARRGRALFDTAAVGRKCQHVRHQRPDRSRARYRVTSIFFRALSPYKMRQPLEPLVVAGTPHSVEVPDLQEGLLPNGQCDQAVLRMQIRDRDDLFVRLVVAQVLGPGRDQRIVGKQCRNLDRDALRMGDVVRVLEKDDLAGGTIDRAVLRQVGAIVGVVANDRDARASLLHGTQDLP